MTLDVEDVDWGAPDPSADQSVPANTLTDFVGPLQESSEPLDLAVLLVDLETFHRRYVMLSDAQAVAVTLWTAHTHALAAAECTPYLSITSPTKRTGKTRLLEVLEAQVAHPWFTSRTTAAALMRKIDAESPTLLLDESDATFKGPAEYAEALRGTLNSGYRRSGKATVCVGQGAAVRAYDFSTFCAKAIAGIGKLPDTVGDRSIPIALRRRTRHEPLARWRERDGHREAAPIRTKLATWAVSAIPSLRDARPELPQTLGDRAMDVWEPLFAIADAAGGDWPTRARQAATNLMGESDDDSVGVQLLTDTREIFESAEVITSSELLRKLAERDDRPWATWSKGQRMTGHALVRLLKPFGVVPGGPMQIAGKVERGYRRASFEDAWLRYLPGPENEDADSITF